MKHPKTIVLTLSMALSLVGCVSDLRDRPTRHNQRYASNTPEFYERNSTSRYGDPAYRSPYQGQPGEVARRDRLEREAARVSRLMDDERALHADSRNAWTERDRERYANLEDYLNKLHRDMAETYPEYGYNRRPRDDYSRGSRY